MGDLPYVGSELVLALGPWQKSHKQVLLVGININALNYKDNPIKDDNRSPHYQDKRAKSST